ncbi:KaiC domain-containing protein [Halorientalis salina]|uniref:KaiC domain-containing protein n=1 Tax=Halorientalis salina TaxID=2932266 RepID=UPI0010AB86CF|nr:KaiC domain-containing protein [Halorientalis salina]
MSEDDSDDDWFESAVGDDGEGEESVDESESPESGSAGPSEADEGSDSPFGSDQADDAGTDGDSPFGDNAGTDEESPFGDNAGADEDSPFGDDGESDADNPFGGGETADSESPFGGSDDTDGDDPFGGSGGGGGDSPFGGDDQGGDSPFGGSGGGDGDDGELFDDDFASAFGGGGDDGGGDFDDEDFESDIPRIKLGIEGLDDMIQGGIPERHLITTIGSAGTGKTTFGLQFLHHGLQKDDPEKAVFITLEQSHEAIMATAAERDWGFEKHEREDNLAIIDLDPVEMANSLDNIRAELPALIEDFGADRLVLDSVSLLEMMYNDQAKRRTQVYDFTRSLKKSGVTTMLTSEASEEHDYSSRHGIIEYLTDAVIHLRYVREETRETRTAVSIQKIRNANHSRETKPYEITGEGISVYQQANIF